MKAGGVFIGPRAGSWMKTPHSRLDGRSFVVGMIFLVIVLVGAGLVVSQASGPQLVGHSMDQVWCSIPAGCIITSWIQDAAITTLKLADNSVSRQKLQTDSVDSSKIINTSIKAVDVDSTEIQRRVSQSCSGIGTIQTVNADGTVSCAPTTIFSTASNSTTQSFSGGGIVLVATVQCPSGTMIFCDGEFQTTTNVQSMTSVVEFVGPTLTPQCKITLDVTGGSGFESATVTANALCKN